MDTPERFFYSEAGRRAKPNLSKRDVKKKSVQRLSAKHRAEKTDRVKLSSSLRQKRKLIEADICGTDVCFGSLEDLPISAVNSEAGIVQQFDVRLAPIADHPSVACQNSLSPMSSDVLPRA